MQTNSMAAFASSGRSTAGEMSLSTECRDLWRVITDNKPLRAKLLRTPLRHTVYRLRRENERSDPLELIDRLIIAMAACGYPEATVELIIIHLKGMKARCYHTATRPLAELDREETKLEALENELVINRLQSGDAITVDLLEQEATINELEAAVQIERARELRRVAQHEARVLPFIRKHVRPMGVSQ